MSRKFRAILSLSLRFGLRAELLFGGTIEGFSFHCSLSSLLMLPRDLLVFEKIN